MSEIMYPSGWGTRERTLDDLLAWHCPPHVTEPEFRRRIRPFLQSKGGLLGIGDRHPRPWGHDISAASSSNRSFHQQQTFADGTKWSCALDLVIRRPGTTHSSGAVPWSEVPIVGSKYAETVGLHMNIPSESWHVQPLEIRGHVTWVNQGRKRPVAGYPLPCTVPAPPSIPAFDPRNGKFALWPIKPDKPLLSTEAFARARRRVGDARWRWTGDAVMYLQGVIFHKAGGRIAIDGQFGPQTEGRVKDVQRWWNSVSQIKATVDGRVGTQETWPIIDMLASR